MKHMVRFSFLAPDVPRAMREQIDGRNLPVDWPEETDIVRIAAVWLDATDERLAWLRSQLSSHGVEWGERHEARYDQVELDAADLLAVYIVSAPLDIHELDDLDVDVPPGHVEPEKPAIVVRKRALPKTGDVREALYGDVLISDRLRDIFLAEGFTGATYRLLVHRDGKPANWSLMEVAQRLPPMSSETTGVVRDVPRGRAMPDDHAYFHQTMREPIQIRYGALDPHALPDIMTTWERFGYSNHAGRTPLGMLIVRNRVRRLMLEQRVRRVNFAPVQFRARSS